MNRLDLTERRDRVLGRLLTRQAEHDPDAAFMIDDVDTYSFGRVDALADAYAAGLADLGVRQGDTVALFMDGGHSLATGGNFYPLRDWSDGQWREARARIEAQNAKDRGQRS